MRICLEMLPHQSFPQSSSHASLHLLQHVKAPPVHPSRPHLFQAQIQVWIIFRLIPLILWSVIVYLTTLANRSLLFKKEPRLREEPHRAPEDRGPRDPFPSPGIWTIHLLKTIADHSRPINHAYLPHAANVKLLI